MRPLLNLPRWISVCAAFGALAVACGGGGGIGPRGTGSAGSRLGVAGWGEEGGSEGTDSGRGGAGGQGRGGRKGLEAWGEGGTGGFGRGGAGGFGRGGAGGIGRGGAGGIGRGGAGGFGRGGAGGFGRGGVGGTKTCGPAEQTYGCPPSLCGNGVIDSCPIRFGTYPFCYDYTFSEACDGTNLGGMTCQSLGFSSGKLRCSSCAYVTIDCSECVSDPAVLRCGPTPLQDDPVTFAIAANDREVALVGVAYQPVGAPLVSFTRFSSTLDGLSRAPIADRAITGNPDLNGNGLTIAVAPRPSGWTVAAFSEGELFLHAIDADGQDAGRVSVRRVPWAFPYLIPRPDGGPLLVWLDQTNGYDIRMYAAVIGADGLSMTTPVDLTVADEFLDYVGRGAFFGGAFYLPMTMTTTGNGYYYYQPKFRIARITASGALISLAEALPGTSVSQPNLVAGDGELHLFYDSAFFDPYTNYGDSTYDWQALDTTGEAASPPVVLGRPSVMLGPLGIGNDAILTLYGSAPETLELVRVTGNGAVEYPGKRFAEATALNLSWIDAVVRGPDVVVAWLNGYDGKLRMARVKP